MKFKEFEAKLNEDVAHFLRNWVEENEAAPDEFPMEMEEGDWWDQFMSAVLA